MKSPALRPNVVAVKRRLAEGLQQLRLRHNTGCRGRDLCEAMTALRDEAMLSLWDAALAGFEPTIHERLRGEVALVAHGGYGRRDVAPHSDVDLMILYAERAQHVTPLAERLFCDVFDSGLTLGHSVRTWEEACQLALHDAQICTSLIESRLLAGNATLFAEFRQCFVRRVRRRAAAILPAIEKARFEERMKFGETVYLLEPNLKRSRGGLRDIQLLRWIGLVRYGAPEPQRLHAMGVLSEPDRRAIQEGYEFLLWLRNEIHFHAERPGDVLDRAEQLRIAGRLGYEPAAGLLPVERFMRDYFRHTDQISGLVERFLAKARTRRRLGRLANSLFGIRVERGFRVGPLQIEASDEGRLRLAADLTSIMQLVDLANLYDKPIDPETWEVVRREAAGLPSGLPPEAVRYFLSLLRHPARLGPLLRDLHEVGLLEQFIPPFIHARGLLQFNQYHKYTVDEHCFRALEQATDLLADQGPLGRAYRRIADKHVLHLALLIHDLGKGHPQDHCEKGLEIARDTARRLNLAPDDAETLAFLVHRHLLMNHLAFRRDTSDDQLVVRFAVDVGSPELLRQLYVLTAADLGAVGPDTWTSWKAEVLTDLYQRAMQHLAGDSPGVDFDEYLQQRRQAVLAELREEWELHWFVRQVQSLPISYLCGTQVSEIADDLRRLRRLPASEVTSQARYLPETQTLQFTVATCEAVTAGIFHKLTGALTSQGLEILAAEIHTMADGLVLDRFWVRDGDYAGEPPPDRLEHINRVLAESLLSPGPPTFRRTWQTGAGRPTRVAAMQSRVSTDNSTSDRFTVLDIFTLDRRGLLYTITRTLFELGLSVGRAKIGTYLDQVVDVFYVTDQEGNKINDAQRLQEIRRRVLEVIEATKDQ